LARVLKSLFYIVERIKMIHSLKCYAGFDGSSFKTAHIVLGILEIPRRYKLIAEFEDGGVEFLANIDNNMETFSESKDAMVYNLVKIKIESDEIIPDVKLSLVGEDGRTWASDDCFRDKDFSNGFIDVGELRISYI